MSMLKTNFAGIKLKNPLILASGILGINANLLKRVEEAGAGAVTTKSIGPKRREGHENPVIAVWECGLINAVGLSSPGIDEEIDNLKEAKKNLKIPLIVSIYGSSLEEFSYVASKVAEIEPELIEINISCPNSKREGQIFGCEIDSAYDVVSKVKDSSGKIAVMPKLTPNTHKIVEVAKACEEAGADAIAAINTVQGMLIDIKMKKPILSFKKGGLSGPAIKPIAIRCVYEIYENVEIPILGMGGITNGKDVIEFIEAGATAVGIGSAIYYRGIDVFSNIEKEMVEIMKELGVKNIKSLIGVAHE